MSALTATYFWPRDLHPAAWWVWALGLAAAASRTTSPWLLGTILVVACYVVVARRSDAPWALSFRLYLYLGLLIICLRVLMRVVFGGSEGSTILIRLPEIPLPGWAAGISLFGPVSAESLAGGFEDGLRLATMVICIGAANALANPKRLLKSMPPALYEIGAAVVVAMSLFPQLAESVTRVRRARRLRGDAGKGIRALRSLIVPVLEDALDRSVHLAASMDTRGYGRTGSLARRGRTVTGGLMIVGLLGVCIGVYATVDAQSPRYLAGPMLAFGVVLAGLGFFSAGRRVRRTRYRPDRWRPAEILTALAGIAVAVVLAATDHQVLSWLPLCGALIGLVPAWLTPAPEGIR